MQNRACGAIPILTQNRGQPNLYPMSVRRTGGKQSGAPSCTLPRIDGPSAPGGCPSRSAGRHHPPISQRFSKYDFSEPLVWLSIILRPPAVCRALAELAFVVVPGRPQLVLSEESERAQLDEIHFGEVHRLGVHQAQRAHALTV